MSFFDLFDSITCYYCKREFDSIQALRAHLRFCQVRVDGAWKAKKRKGIF